MNDTFYPATAITNHVGAHPSHPHYRHQHHHHHHTHPDRPSLTAPLVDGIAEDDGEISCFCGFSDDDGNTVACDDCGRWQHILCYYPEYDGRGLPTDLQHYCVECRPRTVDVHAAHSRQRQVRDQQEAYDGAKRAAAKSHKKKAKESPTAPYTNGWPIDKARHDRNSASPRDQPPPAKRPKTSHRTSDSTTSALTKTHSRKRTTTNAAHLRSVSQTPPSPIALYSEQFLRCYHEDEWARSEANVMDALQVTNALSHWLHLPNDEFMKEVKVEKGEVLNRWDTETPDDIPGKPQLEIVEQFDKDFVDAHGNSPSWKTIISHDSLHTGAYIGELRGRIGLKDEYKRDPSNRWSSIRHPEPFVFFHPSLPIYIDARHEGTDLRYVRRSCNPNARLQILVTKGTDYHFCFMASRPIEPGEEISIGWDTAGANRRDSSVPRALSTIKDADIDELKGWVSNVLSNCGPCACQRALHDCLMSRFDLRRFAESDENLLTAKASKLKKKKGNHRITPLNTHALNSRSGSEARRVEQEDEPTDSRSASGSADRDSASRDHTPNTFYTANGSMEPKLSERERKKLAKEEEMFRRQEQEQSGKQAKKKRHSGTGSEVNTPTAASSKASGHTPIPTKWVDSGTSKQPGLSSAKSTSGKRPRAATHKLPAEHAIEPPRRQKPEYVSTATQCDMDLEEAATRAAKRNARPPIKYISVTQMLLRRCAVNNVKSKRAKSPKSVVQESGDTVMEDGDDDHLCHTLQQSSAAPESRPSERALTPPKHRADDIQMTDVLPAHPDEVPPSPWNQWSNPSQPQGMHQPTQSIAASEPSGPPVLPWPPDSEPVKQEPSPPPKLSQKTPSMHLEMPPPPTNFTPSLPLTQSASSPHSITGAGLAQSPASLNTPLFSPSVMAAVTPSPAKRLMSLSDYTKRSKAKDKEHDVHHKVERDSSPASVASGPLQTPMQTSSTDPSRLGGGEVGAGGGEAEEVPDAGGEETKSSA